MPRPKLLSNDQIKELSEQVKNGIPKWRIGEHFGITRKTVYNYIHFMKQSEKEIE